MIPLKNFNFFGRAASTQLSESHGTIVLVQWLMHSVGCHGTRGWIPRAIINGRPSHIPIIIEYPPKNSLQIWLHFQVFGRCMENPVVICVEEKRKNASRCYWDENIGCIFLRLWYTIVMPWPRRSLNSPLLLRQFRMSQVTGSQRSSAFQISTRAGALYFVLYLLILTLALKIYYAWRTRAHNSCFQSKNYQFYVCKRIDLTSLA